MLLVFYKRRVPTFPKRFPVEAQAQSTTQLRLAGACAYNSIQVQHLSPRKKGIFIQANSICQLSLAVESLSLFQGQSSHYPRVLRRAGLWSTGLARKEKLNHKDRDCTDWADLKGQQGQFMRFLFQSKSEELKLSLLPYFLACWIFLTRCIESSRLTRCKKIPGEGRKPKALRGQGLRKLSPLSDMCIAQRHQCESSPYATGHKSSKESSIEQSTSSLTSEIT